MYETNDRQSTVAQKTGLEHSTLFHAVLICMYIITIVWQGWPLLVICSYSMRVSQNFGYTCGCN